MKQFLTLFIALFTLSNYCTSQNTDWAVVGASWHYEYTSFGIEGFTKYEVEKDTIVNGQTCSKVNIVNEFSNFGEPGYSNTEPSFYTYEEDSILYFTTQNKFDTLMNLKASPRDSWKLTNQTCTDERLVEVIDTGRTTINGCTNKWVYYTYEGFTTIVDTFYSYYGSVNHAFAYFDYCEDVVDKPSSTNLRCFQDGNCFYLNGVEDCESLDIKSESVGQHEISIFPNPTNDKINLKLPSYFEKKEVSYKLVDFTGKVILSETLISSAIDVSTIDPGVYFVKLEYEGQNFGSKRILIE